MQPNVVNMNEMDYSRWNEWDGLWAERNEKKVWTGGNEMKYKQLSVDWRKWDETWTMKSKM